MIESTHLEAFADIVEVTVESAAGLGISGAPHDLAYLSPDGTIEFATEVGTDD